MDGFNSSVYIYRGEWVGIDDDLDVESGGDTNTNKCR